MSIEIYLHINTISATNRIQLDGFFILEMEAETHFKFNNVTSVRAEDRKTHKDLLGNLQPC